MTYQKLIEILGAAAIAIATFFVGRCTNEAQSIPITIESDEGCPGQGSDEKQDPDRSDTAQEEEIQ